MMKLFTVRRRKLKKKRGFTLVETLITMLILLMVTAVVAGGVPTAANAYYKVIDAANAQILLSETVMRLRSELAVAVSQEAPSSTTSDPEDPDDGPDLLKYTSGSSGWTKVLSNSNNGITIKEETDISAGTPSEGPKKQEKAQLLVPSKMSGTIESKKPLVTKCDSIVFVEKDGEGKTVDSFRITNLRVEKDGNVLVSIDFDIRNIIPEFSK